MPQAVDVAQISETLLIDHIKKLARASDPASKQVLFASMHKQLTQLFKDPNEGLVLKYFDVMAWVESRLNGAAIAETVKRRSASA